MSDYVHVKGLKELNEALQSLPVKMEINVMRGALRAGINVIKERAKATAPVGAPSGRNVKKYGGRRGLLRDSTRVSVRLKTGTVTASLKAGGKAKGGGDAYYATIVHQGAKPHVIKAKPGKMLRLRGGRLVKMVNHPGFAGNPWMQRAFDGQNTSAVYAVGNYISKRLATQHGINVPGPGNYDDPEI